MKSFPVTKRTTITRMPKRGSYDQQHIYSILDESLICTIAFSDASDVRQIPTTYCRLEDSLYIHGSVGSSYMRILQSKCQVCICVSILDGLVLARSAFHHSMNYRSVILYSQANEVTDLQEKREVMKQLINRMEDGRWDKVRQPTQKEWKATKILSFPIHEASAKLRQGPPVDDLEDKEQDVWAGTIPVHLSRGKPIPDNTHTLP